MLKMDILEHDELYSDGEWLEGREI